MRRWLLILWSVWSAPRRWTRLLCIYTPGPLEARLRRVLIRGFRKEDRRGGKSSFTPKDKTNRLRKLCYIGRDRLLTFCDRLLTFRQRGETRSRGDSGRSSTPAFPENRPQGYERSPCFVVE
jgi:hypothetical protein